MSVSFTRCIVCWALLVAVPPGLVGQPFGQNGHNVGETPAAILHTQGGVWLNGSEAADSTAVFLGDVLETKPGFSASLTLDGATILLQPESVAQLEQDVILLDHGSVSVGTPRSFKVRVNCISIVPVQNEWTQFDVTDLTGTVEVAANKKDVNVEHTATGGKGEAAPMATIHEGQHGSYDESQICGEPRRPTGAGSTSMSPKWIAVGAGGGGLLICLIAHCFGGGGGGHTSISPSSP
jgi:ferric-dicitrate binding protein FerR (iron transport regulator)